ncbi:NCS2 family permease [Flammeovirga yaeyamensis]|uniref:NCS2 family permease n=1 Tax=Flammeovirga yaeyamensis TaxID=367791 RepID=A0AAX1N9U5_9BACT|nr:NCS2 family permease [Flammeovirga yaeyamensis]MBB3699322.1 AGZA family xanthine/uracil permease-like MFS transporter [Flammeovirga yaeyamensis]NMF35416.1 NCS2 family permease [Flammeovirga yaeyamensis]QWG04276.1 NCS2 family permease [Flammeovirga yaeyamensis]
MELLDKIFKLKENNTTVSKEFIGGLTTFLTMAYIIFVNPDILGEAGMDKPALFSVTLIAAIIGTLLAAFWGKMPFAMAPGMGLNAFFTYTLVLGAGVPWETALGIVFISGVAFVILTFMGVREKIANAIPLFLRISVTAGIGLFITFIGMQNMGLIVASPATLVTLGKFNPAVIISLIGFFIIVILEYRKVTGGILIGILFITISGIIVTYLGENYTWFSNILGESDAYKIILPKTLVDTPPSIAPIFMKLDIMSALKWTFIGPIFSFMFVDLFDSLSTIIACSNQAGLTKKDGSVPRLDKILEADAASTVVGSVLGTSTTTIYIESASGIASGARTGLASVFTALLMFACLFFAPVAGIVPKYATAPALLMVGVYMFMNIKEVKFDSMITAVPAFLTIILMPLTYSISMGITFGFISYVLLMVLGGKAKELPVTMYVIGALSVLNLIAG